MNDSIRARHGLVLAWAFAALTATAAAQPPPPPDPTPGDGPVVLTQGPLHEAFAEPLVYDPAPNPVVPKEPPPPIQELPPDQKPDGPNVQWVPGYWSWVPDRNDFLWVSGLW